MQAQIHFDEIQKWAYISYRCLLLSSQNITFLCWILSPKEEANDHHIWGTREQHKPHPTPWWSPNFDTFQTLKFKLVVGCVLINNQNLLKSIAQKRNSNLTNILNWQIFNLNVDQVYFQYVYFGKSLIYERMHHASLYILYTNIFLIA